MRRLTMIALTATAVTVAGAALAVGSSEGSHPERPSPEQRYVRMRERYRVTRLRQRPALRFSR
jgi:rRNA maturation protein Nop10